MNFLISSCRVNRPSDFAYFAISLPDQLATVMEHYEHLLEHYGEQAGSRIARKHLGWYAQSLPSGDLLRRHINLLTDAEAQIKAVQTYFEAWADDQLLELPAMWAGSQQACAL